MADTPNSKRPKLLYTGKSRKTKHDQETSAPKTKKSKKTQQNAQRVQATKENGSAITVTSYNPKLAISALKDFIKLQLNSLKIVGPLVDQGSLASPDFLRTSIEDIHLDKTPHDALAACKENLLKKDETKETARAKKRTDHPNKHLKPRHLLERVLRSDEDLFQTETSFDEHMERAEKEAMDELSHDRLFERIESEHFDCTAYNTFVSSIQRVISDFKVSLFTAILMARFNIPTNMAVTCELAVRRLKWFNYNMHRGWLCMDKYPQYMQRAMISVQTYLSTPQIIGSVIFDKVENMAVWLVCSQLICPYFIDCGTSYWASTAAFTMLTILPPSREGEKPRIVPAKFKKNIKMMYYLTEMEHPAIIQKPLHECKASLVECARQQGKTTAACIILAVMCTSFYCELECKAHKEARSKGNVAEINEVMKAMDKERRIIYQTDNKSEIYFYLSNSVQNFLNKLYATSGTHGSGRGYKSTVGFVDEFFMVPTPAILSLAVHLMKSFTQMMFTSTPSAETGSALEQLFMSKQMKGFYILKLGTTCDDCIKNPAFGHSCKHLVHTKPSHIASNIPQTVVELFSIDPRYFQQEIQGTPRIDSHSAFPFHVVVSTFAIADVTKFIPDVFVMRSVARLAYALSEHGIEPIIAEGSTNIDEKNYAMAIAVAIQPEFVRGLVQIQSEIKTDVPLTTVDVKNIIWDNENCNTIITFMCDKFVPHKHGAVSGSDIVAKILEYCLGTNTKLDVSDKVRATFAALIKLATDVITPHAMRTLVSTNRTSAALSKRREKRGFKISDDGTIYVTVDLICHGNSEMTTIVSGYVDPSEISGRDTESEPAIAILGIDSWKTSPENLDLMKKRTCSVLSSVLAKHKDVRTVVVWIEINTNKAVSYQLATALCSTATSFNKKAIPRYKNDSIQLQKPHLLSTTDEQYGMWSTIETFSSGYFYLNSQMRSQSFITLGEPCSSAEGTRRASDALNKLIRQLLCTELEMSVRTHNVFTHQSTMEKIQARRTVIKESEKELDDLMKTIQLVAVSMKQFRTYKRILKAANDSHTAPKTLAAYLDNSELPWK
jgi:hypothetical protein